MKHITSLIDKTMQKSEFIRRERLYYETMDFWYDLKKNFYDWFLLLPCPPESSFKSIRYNICYRYRVIYQGRFMSRLEAEKFIDDHFWDLKFRVNIEFKSWEYFTWWYNYYGESID